MNELEKELYDAILSLRYAFYVEGKTKTIKQAFEKTHALVAKIKELGIEEPE